MIIFLKQSYAKIRIANNFFYDKCKHLDILE